MVTRPAPRTRWADARTREPLWAPVWAATVVLVGLAVLAVLARSVQRSGPLVLPYQAVQYWLTYDEGFSRRALPGQVLSAFGTPTLSTVSAVGLALSVAAMVALLVLVVSVAARGARPVDRLACLAVLVASPLTLTLVARDLGRYDAVGIVAMVLVALLPTPRGRRGTAAVLVTWALLAAVATASEEFLLALVVPLVLLRARQLPAAGRWMATAAALAPAAALGVASLLIRTSPVEIDTAETAARTAGYDVPDPNAVSLLSRSLGAARQDVVDIGAGAVLLYVGTAAVLFALTCYVVGRLVGAGRAAVVVPAVGFALFALALSAIGVDFRRWWSLAFVGLLCCLVIAGRGAARDPAPGTATGRLLPLALTVLSLPLALVPVYPVWAYS